MTFQPSAAQQRFFDWVENESGNAILEAVAGAGKTTTILNGIEKMHGKVWFGVYNKKMADEIKGKVAERPELKNRPFPAESLDTSTFHSLGYGIIRFANGKGVETDVDERKVEKIVDQVIARKEAEAQEELWDLRGMKNAVIAVVSMAKNRGFVDPGQAGFMSKYLTNMRDSSKWVEMINHFDFADSLPEDVDLNRFVHFCQHVLQTSNRNTLVVDMDDMVYLPLALNMRVGYRFYDWVLIDEAQDTNPTRRALARKVLKREGRLVAVGDPHQAIFGFTGADNDSLEQIERDFGAIKLPLTVTYRCPQVIVAHAQQWVSHIQAHESAPMGELKSMEFDGLPMLIKSTPRDEHGETAILCRYNKYLVALCFKLIREGVPAKIEGRSIGEGLLKLATRWKSIKTVNALETKLKDYMAREVKKALANQQEDRADRVTDQVETLLVILDRAREQNIDQVADLRDMVTDMFADNVADRGLVTLCSAHKSKGLEWNTVYLLGRDELMPSKMANQQWQVDQEINLIYVAVTRAKQTLVEVSGVYEAPVESGRPLESAV